MRGRPLKEDRTATPDDSLRRARGRAAQRRYRHRKEQTLTETQARNDKLEAIVEGMAKAFLNFGDRVMHSEAATSQGDLGPAYCEVVKTFLCLTAEATEEEDWPGDQSPELVRGDDPEPCRPRTSHSVIQTLAEPESSSCSSYESVSTEPFPISQGTSKHLGLDTSPFSVQSLSPGIILMPTQNPLLSGDYSAIEELSYPEPSLWKRLLRYGMQRSYRALESADDQQHPKSWLARSHHFSLRHATRWHLLFLTKLGLDKIVEDGCTRTYGPRLPPKQLRLDKVFGTVKHRELAHAVLTDLEREGIWPEMMRCEEVEDYISSKGKINLHGNRLELQLFSPRRSRTPSPKSPSADLDLQTVILDAEKLMWKICEESICLGDGMAFPKRIINNAIVYSAVHISHDI